MAVASSQYDEQRYSQGRSQRHSGVRTETSRAPRIVGESVLLAYAVEDFLDELTRQSPWYRVRYEALLGELEAHLHALTGREALLEDHSPERARAWLATLDSERSLAEQALEAFNAYLDNWGWLD